MPLAISKTRQLPQCMVTLSSLKSLPKREQTIKPYMPYSSVKLLPNADKKNCIKQELDFIRLNSDGKSMFVLHIRSDEGLTLETSVI